MALGADVRGSYLECADHQLKLIARRVDPDACSVLRNRWLEAHNWSDPLYRYYVVCLRALEGGVKLTVPGWITTLITLDQ
jgi:hypothetical protein